MAGPAYPKTYRALRRSTGPYPLRLEVSTESLPETLEPTDVVVKIHAVSLNYRDLAMMREGKYPVPVLERGISGSDSAGSVVAVGSSVRRFRVGDRVTQVINPGLLVGDERDGPMNALGGDIEGTLREYTVVDQEQLVRLPEGIDWEEASTITGVGITAWVSLDGLHEVPRSATALLQGTGGVSVMGLLVCLAIGITPIITSSSDAKLDRMRAISPDIVRCINYKTTPDVATEVLRLTDGRGVDYVFNNVGLSSIPDDLRMLSSYGGSIALIGFLEGFEAKWDPSVLMGLLMKAAKIKGLLAGSRKDLEAVCQFLDQRKVDLKPLVDKVFAFDDAAAAFEYLESGQHVGKIVIKI